MNYLAPGLRELARIVDRLGLRLRLIAQRRQLARLESKLGLLGWQQADYDHGTQQHVDRLTDFERAQAQLTNESAAFGLAVQQLEERKVAERATFESQRATRIAARDPLIAPVEESECTLQAKERECKEVEERLPALDREKLADEEKYRALLAKGNHTPAQHAEVLRLQRRVVSLPLEKWEWQQKLATWQAEIPPLTLKLQERRAALSVETEALRILEKSFAESDEALTAEIAARQRDKQKLEKQVNGLEKAKTQPYREIGKVLADQRIEPLNQPEALTDVLKQRDKITAQESRLITSREKSRREKRLDVWASWVLLLTFAVLILGVAWFTLRGR